MITAVDTNVLIDIFGADKKHGRASAEALRRCMKGGAVCACGVVWAETSAAFSTKAQFLKMMRSLAIDFSPLTQEASIEAGSIWRKYRKKGGGRKRVMADFLIGAHALGQCDRLLTRDRGFYREYMKTLRVIDPS